MLNEASVRKELAKRLGQDVPDALWVLLKRRGYARDVIHHDTDEARNVLIEEARSHLNFVGQLGLQTRSPRSEGVRKAWSTSAKWATRINVLETHISGAASRLPSLVRFRRRYLRGKVLSIDAAAELLNSPAIRVLSLDNFTFLGVDVAAHKSRLVAAQGLQGQSPAWPEDYALRLESKIGKRDVPLNMLPDDAKRALRDGPEGRIGILLKPSVFADLQAVSRKLEARYGLGWGRGLMLALTGRCTFPFIDGWSTSTRNEDLEHCTITLKIQPWVPAEVVAKVYRLHQRGLLGGKNRPVKQELLPLLSHVLAMKEQGRTWKEIMAAWNQKFSRRQYRLVSNMSRDYQRVRRLVLFPPYARHVPRELPWS
jgi:hypothetical protein